MKSIIIENTPKDVYSTYVKCDCGAEILEFQARKSNSIHKSEIKDAVLTSSSDFEFILRYYGLLSHRDIRYSYNDFYFTDISQLKTFLTLLKRAIDKNIEEDISENFCDELLPHRIRKKYGSGGISVIHSKDGTFTWIRKYRNLKKKKKPSWEIVLGEDVLKDLISNIEQVIKQTETTFSKRTPG